MDQSSNGTRTKLTEGVTDFGNDVATLLELQAKLAALDIQESSRRAAVPFIALAGAGVLILGAVTVGLFGVADLLARALGIANGWAMILTAIAALGVGGATLWASAYLLKASLVPLRRSREELTRNLSWLRTVLLFSGRPPTKRGC